MQTSFDLLVNFPYIVQNKNYLD
uniref:Uncharacterized protein n=1 Tax=Rhizophora mucronata TaxID=61149 RepID=A0A2P2NIE4_RHIMU